MLVVAISSLDPVQLEYSLDPNLGLEAKSLYFSNGVTLYHTNILDGFLDVTFNKDNVVLLTDRKPLHGAATDISDKPISFEDYIGSTAITLTDGSADWSTVSNVNGDGSKVFQLEFVDGLISIVNDSGEYLTYFPDTQTISFSAALVPDVSGVQHFIYLQDDDQVILNTRDSARTLVYDENTNEIRTTPVISETNPITINHVFRFVDFKSTGLDTISATQSNWVVYERGSNDISVNHNKTYADTSHNFLITAPYKAIDSGSLSINIANLKNYQTADYDYYLGVDGPNARSYDRLVTGLNQEGGYDNIYLAFNSGTSKVDFAKDKYTYFHFSTTLDSIALSGTTFVDDGAIAGPSPWRSDKIFKKQAGYPDVTNWGKSSIQNGVWFCSWLSGNNDPESKPVWMDRYFDPVYAAGSPSSIQSALLTAIDVSDISDVSNPTIWDMPSEMVFEAGGLYTYYHMGEERIAEVVNNLKANAGLVLDYNHWTSSVIVDASPSGYNGTINGFIASANSVSVENIKNRGYKIGNTFGYIEKVDEIFDTDDLTIAFWIDVDDWNNIRGDQIFGNYYNGGIGVFNNNAILTPYIGMYEFASGKVIHLNSQLTVLNNTDSGAYANGRAIQIKRANYDGGYYVLDTNQNILVYDIENILTNVISLNAIVPGISASHFDLDGDLNFHIVDPHATPNTRYYIIDRNGNTLLNDTAGTTGMNNMFAMDRYGNAVFPGISGLRGVTINSDDELYYIDATYLYRGANIIWQASSMQNLICDLNDNIWITYGYNRIAKIDKTNNLLATAVLPVSSNTPGDISMSLSRELSPTGLVECVWVVDSRTQYIYKYDTDCNLLSSVAVADVIPSLSSTTVYGISDNGYEYQRNNTAPNIHIPGLTVKAFLREQYINGTDVKINLHANTANMSGPKHIAVTFSRSLGQMKFYIDGEVVDSATFDPFRYRISANRNVLSLVIGTNSGKRAPLIASLDQPGYYTFDGTIGDINIFTKALDQWDIKALSNSVRVNVFDDMRWNMPTGNRNFIEEIDRFFAHKMPGNKSQFFNIKLSGLNITDDATRELIETSIKNVLQRINPAYVSLYKIIWE